ncbi:MAG: hypothetical protein DRP82_06365, partial [Planctomycetota bacterium]
DLNFNGKKIYLEGVGYHTAGAQPVIDCQQAGRAFYFGSGETKDSIVDNIQVSNGSASLGGAILCEGNSSPALINCEFVNNQAGGGGLGGAICLRDGSSPLTVNCVFDGNTAGDAGGAVYCYDGTNPTFINCVFKTNSAYADEGGAIRCGNNNLVITGCVFQGNYADFSGGALACDAAPTITNCLFVDNSSGFTGGALSCYAGSSPTVTNCTFSGNLSDYGGAVFCPGSVTINNSILWGDAASTGGEICVMAGGLCVLNYCCVDGSGYGYASGGGTIDDTNHCIYQDPQFVDAANGDYRLKDTSPCIDAGDDTLVPSGVTTDLDGNQRVVDGNNDGTAIVDIGAYEYHP